MENKHYVGTVGTVILVETGADISTATDLKLKVRKPDETEVEWDGVLDGTTKIKYTIIADDWDQAGPYYLQASLTLGGWTGLGETASFTVFDTYN